MNTTRIHVPVNRYPDYVSPTLAEREQIRSAIIAHSGSVKAFAEKYKAAGAYTSLTQVLSGDKRICPKALGKLRAVLGISA